MLLLHTERKIISIGMSKCQFWISEEEESFKWNYEGQTLVPCFRKDTESAEKFFSFNNQYPKPQNPKCVYS